MSEWKPIETAPKNKDPVIVAFKNREVGVARFNGEWLSLGGYRIENLTHWMPLPEPPK